MRYLSTLIVILLTLLPVRAEEFHRTSSQKAVKTTTDIGLVTLPLATLAGLLIDQDREGLKQFALSEATNFGATMLIKLIVREDRPDHSNHHSFPSGHTSISFATATFLQRRYGWKFGVPAYIVSTYIGWGRVYTKKHHWWDVLTGAAIGAGASLIYTRPFAEKYDLTLSPYAGPDGFILSASLTF